MALRDPYPLSWPEGWTRTKPTMRTRARFSATFATGRDSLRYELGRINAANIVITSNVRISSNGTPDGRTTDARIEDPGVAVWWQQKGGVERVMACDRWRSPGENMRAIAKSLEALRGIHRWGASQIVDRAFGSFNALPAGGATHVEPDWWEVLGVDEKLFELPSEDLLAIVTSRYKKAAALAHPDRGGSQEDMARINTAYETAKTYCANSTEDQ